MRILTPTYGSVVYRARTNFLHVEFLINYVLLSRDATSKMVGTNYQYSVVMTWNIPVYIFLSFHKVDFQAAIEIMSVFTFC